MTAPHVHADSEALRRQIEEDELDDKLELALGGIIKMTVIEYAKTRSRKTGMLIAPQNVYYYIRSGKIDQEVCICGRKVIDVKSADDFFNALDKKGKT